MIQGKNSKKMDKKQEVHESLRFKIIYNVYQPGEVLNEKKLMAQYKIGRTPLREILLNLKRDNLINMLPRLGTIVTSIEISDLRDVIDIRMNLEALVARLATKNIKKVQIQQIKELIEDVKKLQKSKSSNTHEKLTQYDLNFHSILYDAARNKRLNEILIEQQQLMARFWFQLDMKEEDFFSQMLKLDTVVEGLEERNVAKVQKALEDHIQIYISRVKEEIF